MPYIRKIITGALAIIMIAPLFVLFPVTTAIPHADAQALTSEERAALEAELAKEKELLKQQEALLADQKKKTGTLQSDVRFLTNQIAATQTKIRLKTIEIQNLTKEITQKSKAITDLGSELERERRSLLQLVKKTNELDQQGTAYVLLSSESVSDFYEDLDSFYAVKGALNTSVTKIKQIKSLTEEEKEGLEDRQSREADTKAAIEAEKRRVEASEREKKSLLGVSQNKEKEYAAIVAERQKKITEIQNKLFQFAGGNTSAIPFAQAYAFAKEASAYTGVREAFILAILTQESNLGRNVGTCNRANDPVSKSWKNVMHPTRDRPAFERITTALGLNPDTTPVSCPIAGGGWGGAMGPAQFIPSTWESVHAEVTTAVGMSANPWRARDAIFASAIYLKRRGGAGGNETNERNAACRYYSGRACDGKKPANSFYGNNVMSIARKIQADIDYLEQYGVSRR
jgi:membrane-bound lytic murein transglycosylase B